MRRESDEDGDSSTFQRRRASDVEVSGPFGTSIRVHGKNAGVAVLFICAVAAVGYMIYLHDKAENEVQQHIQDNQKEQSQRLDELIYMMSLSEKEREHLNIVMPDSLRRKMLILNGNGRS